ncbi:MAG: hypothetical protein JW787_12700 [Sedimentisphaerales bacterium]|nr:hypothetical protein [Sedimentisphaerales bacterium]
MTRDKITLSEKRRRVKTSHVLIMLFVLLLAAFAFYRIYLKNELNERIETIRAAGYPVTFEELNQWYSIPMGVENSAYIVLDAIGYYKEPNDGKLLPVTGNAELPGRTETMSDEMKKLILQFLIDNQKSLELLHKTAGLEHGRYPADFRLGQGVLLTHISQSKDSAQLLQLEAVHAAENENSDIAFQSIQSIFGVAFSLDNEPVMVSQSVRIACQDIAVSVLEYSLNKTAFSDEQLIELGNACTKAEKAQGMLNAVVGERIMALDLITQPQSIYFNPNSNPVLFSFPPVLTLYKTIGLSESDAIILLKLTDDIIKAYNFPPHQRREAAKAIDLKIKEIPNIHVLLGNILPSFGRFIILDLKNITRLSLARTALAVQRYRLKHKKLPDSLGNLVPEYIESIPLDPFDGEELRYKRLDKGFVIYSIGEDLSDDNGREMPKEKKQKMNSTWDITFIVEK